MKQYLFLLLSFAFLATSCNMIAPDPVFIADIDKMVIDMDGGDYTIEVKANCPWRATARPTTGIEFFSLLSAGGQADGIIRLSAWQNVMNYEKQGVIEIEYGNGEETRLSCIEVVQEPREPIMRFWSNESSDIIPAYGGTVEVPFFTNTPWMNCMVADAEQSDSVQLRIRQDPPYEHNQEIIEGLITAKIPVNTTYETRTFSLELTDRPRTTVFDTFVIHQAGRQK